MGSATPDSPRDTTSAAAERFTVTADDATELVGYRYPVGGTPRGVIVVGSATAVPQRYYRRFAEAAVARGYETLTLDYRGTGESAPDDLRGYRMDYRDWMRRDLSALIDRAGERGVPVFVVGHSYGGTAFGFLPRSERVTALHTFGSGSGWHGWMPPAERVRVLLMWRVLGPILVRRYGYMPWSRIFSGTDLPTDVFHAWRRWVSYPRFALDDPQTPDAPASYARIRVPIVTVASTDDRWAPPASRDALASGYVNARVTPVTVTPEELGVPHIGHMGYFRPFAAPLWDAAFDRFDGML